MKTFYDWAKQYAAAVERLKTGYFDHQTTEKLGENVAELKANLTAMPIETVADALEALAYVKNEVAEVCVRSDEVDTVLEALRKYLLGRATGSGLAVGVSKKSTPKEIDEEAQAPEQGDGDDHQNPP